jgi:hypothetical protein
MPPLQGTIQYWLCRLQGGHRRNSAPRWINLDRVCNDTTYLIQSVRRRSRGHSGFSKKQNIVACPPCALVELRDWVLGDAISNGTCLENVARSADHRGPANRTSSSYLPVSRLPPPLIYDASHENRAESRGPLCCLANPGCLTNLAQSLAFCGLAPYLGGTRVAAVTTPQPRCYLYHQSISQSSKWTNCEVLAANMR